MSKSSLPILSTALSLLILVYFIVYAAARPTPELVSAVAFEVAIFLFIVIYRFWRLKHPTKETRTLAALAQKNATARRLSSVWQSTAQIALTLSLVYLGADLTALFLSRSGYLEESRLIYKTIAPPLSSTIHPGFSLELLAGALCEAGKLDEAEPLKLSILKLRRSMVKGPHELTAGIDADLGDFYKRKGNLAVAEDYYKQAVNESKLIHYPLGWGSPTTKLGTLYLSEGRLAEAETCLKEALLVRRKIFGEKSDKVADTLVEYAKLSDKQGHASEAADMRSRAADIYASHKVKESSAWPVIMAVVSLLLLIFREKFVTLFAGLWLKQEEAAVKRTTGD